MGVKGGFFSRTFGPEEARTFYDRFGARQDSQAFYEDDALDVLIAEGDFGAASHVLEIGCGTGRLAERLFGECLASSATYVGVDVSRTMVELTRERLHPWADRASVLHVDGESRSLSPADGSIAAADGSIAAAEASIAAAEASTAEASTTDASKAEASMADASKDRVVSTYVFDLMTDDRIQALLHQCHRILEAGGLLCHAGISPGEGVLTRTVSGVWKGLHTLAPRLVGGCQPIVLRDHLPAACWRVRSHQRVVSFGVTSEVLVAERI